MRRGIIRDGLAVAVATGAYGISFGAISVTSGLNVWQTCALSLLVFSGASQFALVGVIGAGGAPMAGAATAWLLGVRNTLYGLKLAPLLEWRGWLRPALSHWVIDESTAMSINRANRSDTRLGFLVTGGGIFVLWNLATFAGALAGQAFGDPKTYGFDAAVAAAFLALLWPRLANGRNRIVALLAVAVALGMVPLSPAGIPVLVAASVAIVAGQLPGKPDPTEIPGQEDLPGGAAT